MHGSLGDAGSLAARPSRGGGPTAPCTVRGGDPDGVDLAVVPHADRTELPSRPPLFNNVTLRPPGSDDFPADAECQAARDLTATAATGDLAVDDGDRHPPEAISRPVDRVDAGRRGRVPVTVTP
ncbi:hypothetical protein ACW4TU_40160 [Streptomyces sp. QTS52]